MQRRLVFLGAISLLAVLTGCGGGGSRDFSLAIAPTTVAVTPGGAAQTITVDCITSKRLYWERKCGSRYLAQRFDGHTDDPIHRARRASAD